MYVCNLLFNLFQIIFFSNKASFTTISPQKSGVKLCMGTSFSVVNDLKPVLQNQLDTSSFACVVDSQKTPLMRYTVTCFFFLESPGQEHHVLPLFQITKIIARAFMRKVSVQAAEHILFYNMSGYINSPLFQPFFLLPLSLLLFQRNVFSPFTPKTPACQIYVSPVFCAIHIKRKKGAIP